ncbi:MAG: DUF1735 domain-containing protein [Chitinophagaceae bacterium]
MRHIKSFILFFIAVIGLTSCLKKDASNIDPYDLMAPVYTMEYIQSGGTTINSGMQYFANGALTFASTDVTDTVSVNARITGTPVSSDVSVTIGQDTKQLLVNYATDSITYVAMPDSVYKILTPTSTIKAGVGYAAFKVVFYPSKINPTKNYMLALTVLNPVGYKVSTNYGAVYFHTIGNPLAGAYVTTGKRYNYGGAVSWSGPPAAYPSGSTDGTTAAYNSTVIAAPVNTKTVKLIMGNVPDPAPVGGSSYYYITGGDANFTTISYNLGSNFAAGYSNISTYILNYVAPTTTQKASFHLITKYNNTTGNAGSDRIIDQTFTQQ